VVLVREAGTIEELKIMASRLVEASEVPFADFDHAITISASVGIARYPDHGSTAELLLAAADNAMYRAKRSDQVHVDVSSRA
jgi:diguanylate cyclase (GGDEF)-like protein